MALFGSTNEEKIWNYLYSKIGNDFGVAGLMGNLQAESGLDPQNLQNTYEKSLGMSDSEYTKGVDNGTYSNFAKDKAGYGLAQWTFWTRKRNLLVFAKGHAKSIGDLEMQLAFLFQELDASYGTVLKSLWMAKSVREASDVVLTRFEKPADQSEAVKKKRASYGEVFYRKYAKARKEKKAMSNSGLVDVTVKSPNHSGKRTHSIDRITPHCVVGQLTAEGIGGCFTSRSRQASCNYGIGKDGRVVLVVDEANRSWCSSSNANDQRAVTIECASDRTSPYAFNDAVYSKLIDLCTDICKRNGKKALIWFGDKAKTLAYSPKSDEMILTVHRWFANKSCPGDWMYARMGDLADKVTARLGGSSASTGNSTRQSAGRSAGNSTADIGSTVNYQWQVTVPDLNIRKKPGTQYESVGYTGKGTFTIVKESNGWGKLKSGAGWISLDSRYGKKVGGNTASNSAAGKDFRWTVTVSDLCIRSWAGRNTAWTGKYTGKGTFTITERKNGFGKLKSGAGWISLDTRYGHMA